MQIRQSLLTGDRPPCPADPNHKVHRHGHYLRCADCDSLEPLLRIARFLCLLCARTISVLPDEVLPYRAVSASKVQDDFDAKVSGVPPPPATQNERGCLKRAWERFSRRAAALAAVLGQMVQIVNHDNPRLIWLQLRRLGSLCQILLLLARPFNISLLANYLCLRPWGDS